MLALVHPPHAIATRIALLVGGVVLNGVATGAYIGAGLGPGPRDGLMTAWAARGHSIRIVRTMIEVSALAAGWALGGTVGVGTVFYALAIGPLAHRFIRCSRSAGRRRRSPRRRPRKLRQAPLQEQQIEPAIELPRNSESRAATVKPRRSCRRIEAAFSPRCRRS